MPNVVNVSEIKAMLFRRHRLLCMLMLQALLRAFQEERSALRLLTEYPHPPLPRLSAEKFAAKGPFYVFQRNRKIDVAMLVVEQWLRQAIRRGETWIQDENSGRVKVLAGRNDLDDIVAFARAELARYAALDARKVSSNIAKEASVGVEPVLHFPDGKAWVRLVSATAFRREGKLMEHCIGRGDYYRSSAQGVAAYLSLRDAAGIPRVTIEVVDKAVVQAQAIGNTYAWDDWYAELAAIMYVMGWEDGCRLPYNSDVVLLEPAIVVHEGDLELSGQAGRANLPRGLHVRGNVVMADCDWLQHLPEHLRVEGNCMVTHCVNLRNLPMRLVVMGNASFAGCRSVSRGAMRIDVRGSLALTDCRRLPNLPRSMRVDGNLDITDCEAMGRIPRGAVICGNIRRGVTVVNGVEDMNRYLQAQAVVTFRHPLAGVWRPPPEFRRH